MQQQGEERAPSEPPALATSSVFVVSPIIPDTPHCVGYDFNKGLDYDALFASFKHSGFQAGSFGKAIDEVNRMLSWRLSDDPIAEDEQDEWRDPEVRKNHKCTIFLSYTSNMASCGAREVIRYLAQHKMVDCIVATAGGVEEDFIKCMAPTFQGEFELSGEKLRGQGLNRIGNLLVPNENYVKFEAWMIPILDKMVEEQKTKGTIWSPSSMIRRFGQEIDNEESIYYWCYKNDIPVYSPALTDGSIGDMIFFHSYRNPGLIVDIAQDIRGVNLKAMNSKKTGCIILGGGVVKHHVMNANLMRNGTNFCVFINTGQEFDGSDSGARPDEAVSWGKIARDAKPVKVYGDASLLFPLLVSQTFAKLPNHTR